MRPKMRCNIDISMNLCEHRRKLDLVKWTGWILNEFDCTKL